VAELLFAVWLHHEGWRIDGLEALGASTDVVATDWNGKSFVFEIKYLGQGEILFLLSVQALGEDGVSFGYIPVYSPLDYMLFRIFEAAKKLASLPRPRVVVMILSEYEAYFEIPLAEHWIDWRNPKFFRKEIDIEEFLREQYASNPKLDHEIKYYISQVDQIWFYEIEHGLTIKRRRIEKMCG
jgi:hypothetical protein